MYILLGVTGCVSDTGKPHPHQRVLADAALRLLLLDSQDELSVWQK
jgi:hypothetical protein